MLGKKMSEMKMRYKKFGDNFIHVKKSKSKM